ncbi:MAG: hypothetical protein V5A72_01330 [Candidatus Nanohaloarchaea archaeon]
MDEIQDRFNSLNTEDVAEKRFEMMKIFESLLNKRVDGDKDEIEKFKSLNEEDGYMYKLSQDFLLSSSTMEKEEKLSKLIEYVKKKV